MDIWSYVEIVTIGTRICAKMNIYRYNIYMYVVTHIHICMGKVFGIECIRRRLYNFFINMRTIVGNSDYWYCLLTEDID